MVHWIKMNEDQFQRFATHSAAGYAQQVEQTYQQPITLQEAMEGLNELLPAGLDTPGHHLFNLHSIEGDVVGVLWFGVSLEHEAETLFIYDLEILPHAQRRGYAKAVLRKVEQWARAQGVKRIELNVFFNNLPARALYRWFGLSPYEMTLGKPLD